MAYYNDFTKKKMSRADHLKQESKWDEEGTHYRKGGTKKEFHSMNSFGSKPYGDKKDFHDKPDFGKHDFHGKPDFRDKPDFGKRDFHGKPDFHDKPDFGKRDFHGKPDFHDKPDFSKRDFHGKPDFHDKPDYGKHDFHGKPGFRPNDRRPLPPKHDMPTPPPAPKHEPPRAPFHDDMPLPPENLLSGRNPIREAIKSGRDIEKLLVAKGDLSGTAREIVAMARERHIPVQMVERARLDEITRNHQGMLAYASAYRYYDVEDMLAEAKEKGEAPFLVILDGVTDPQNLGAIIRTAACVGAHGVIVPERRAVGLTPSAVKASAGAIETVKVARVTNMARTLDMLKKEGVWLYAADMVGEDYRKVDFSGPAAIIIGAEGEGVSRLVLEAADHRVSLPMKDGVGSLNASVAAGVMLYAALSYHM